MLVATAHPQTLRSALDVMLGIWAGAEVLLRIANHDRERGSDWTFPVVIASVVIAINLGFRASTIHSANIGGLPVIAWIGLTVLFAGVGLRIWSILTLGRLFTFAVTVQDGHRLIERGPYRYVRHPSYTGGLVGLLGAGVVLDNWMSVAALLLIPLVGVLIRVSYEERQLRDGLGSQYVDYAARTARLVPSVW